MTAEAKRERARATLKRRRERLKAANLCVDCGKQRHRKTGVLCRDCVNARTRRAGVYHLCANCADSNCLACDGCDCTCAWMDQPHKIAMSKAAASVRRAERFAECAA